MKTLKYYFCALSGLTLANACTDDVLTPGNPIMNFKTELSDAYFGDSLPFTINASDMEVPLSTLKAQLFFGEEVVSETVIRTKVSGEDYTGKIYIPYHANIPNGTATLKYVLQNIHFTITEKEQDLRVSRPRFPYLTLVTKEKEYRMDPVKDYLYSVSKSFPSQVKGYIKSPKYGENGNELTFGWSGGQIVEDEIAEIPFSNSKAGKYAITFDTHSYEAAPFVKFLINGNEMEMLDDVNYMIQLDLQQGQEVTVSGIPSFDEWWIDTDFFEKQADGSLKFMPVSGEYRLIANSVNKYFVVEAMKGTEPAALNEDGSGAMWIIGNGIGKPSVSANDVGWKTDKALCMAQVAPGKYQITAVAGKQISATGIDFKFFHQKGWGGEFSHETLTTKSDIILIGSGKDDGGNGVDKGNLAIVAGKELTPGYYYRLTVDVTAGIESGILTVEKLGEEPGIIRNPLFNGEQMEKVDDNNYKVEKVFVTGDELSFGGDINLGDWWIDPDYFILNQNKLQFVPMGGKFRLTADYANKYIQVEAMNGESLASLQPDGRGAIWILGNGVGKPSYTNSPAWSGSRGLCMTQVSPGIYCVTVEPGVQIATSGLDFKFFHQRGWGGEFSSNTLSSESDLIKVTDSGNINLHDGVTIDEDATYVLTVDVTAGIDKAVLKMTLK